MTSADHPLRILYLGSESVGSTSRSRAQALMRLGHHVRVIDPEADLRSDLGGPLRARIHYRTGYRLMQRKLGRWVADLPVEPGAFDLAWVNSGELFGAEAIERLRAYAPRVVLYTSDDPTGPRDGRRFATLLEGLASFDACVVPREITAAELRAHGARQVVRTWLSYDEVVNAPVHSLSEVPQRFRSEIAFIGTWMRHEHRDDFLLEVAGHGIPISIWGNSWEKSPRWRHLRRYWRGPAVHDRDYALAVRGARACLGMLSKGNRDLYTRRSVEVPYMGGLLCGERTPVHADMFEEGVEALFWSDAAECADQCRALLDDPDRAERMRLAGMRRVRELEVGNEEICRRILATLDFAAHAS
jgi:spore maturation protein CgeB